MSWYNLLGFICTLSFLLPVAVIGYNRFYKHRSLASLLIYFSIVAAYNLMTGNIIPVSKNFLHYFGILANYLDVPLILMSLLFFCPDKPKQRVVFLLISIFISYETLITFIFGFKILAIVYIMGPGIVLVLAYTFYLFLRQVKFSIMLRKNQGKMVMLASIFFAYACYAIIYYFFYILKTPFKEDAMLLYHLASTIASVVMSVGLQLLRKRMRELEALKITRKELALFFGHADQMTS